MTIGRSSIVICLTAMMCLYFAKDAVADSLSVPNDFMSGQSAKASEVNANFSAVESAVNNNDSRITANSNAFAQYAAPVVLDGDGNMIGMLVNIDRDVGADALVLTPQSYFVSIRLGNGSLFTYPSLMFFATSNCSGTPYSGNPAGQVFGAFDAAGVAALFYTERNSIATADFEYLSYGTQSSCNTMSGASDFAWPATPNDPGITGVSDQDYSLPIQIGQPQP